MSWGQPGSRVHRTLLEPPEDGIALSKSASRWLARRLRAIVNGASPTAKDRVRRGQNYARGGRARDLVLLPGSASCDVWCDEVYRPTVRVAPLPSSAWRKVIDELASDLSGLAALMEGELPEDLVDRLSARGVELVPAPDELSNDCDCGDWADPCTHVATLLQLLADALDGDPFLLLTLRGRSATELLSALRERWGDDRPMEEATYASEEPLPDGDPFTAPGGLPNLRSTGAHDGSLAAGLRALGPAPGGADLLATLGPLYEAGLEASRKLLEAVPDREPPKRRPREVVLELAPEPGAAEAVVEPVGETEGDDAPLSDGIAGPAPATRAVASAPALVATASVQAAAPDDDPTGRIVDLLADEEGLTSAALASRLDWSVSDVRRELLALEELGLLYRTVDGDDQRWWLG